MSQIIEMRSRIKTVDTIQKITHAMQLVAMSTHLRLRDKRLNIEEYHAAVSSLFLKMHRALPQWSHPALYPSATLEPHPLVIIVGSNKGLCGTFNTSLMYWATTYLSKQEWKHASMIVIGKKMNDYVSSLLKAVPFTTTIIQKWDELSADTIAGIVAAVTGKLEIPHYTEVVVLSTTPGGFFSQQQIATSLIPFHQAPLWQEKVITPADQQLSVFDGTPKINEPLAWDSDPAQLLTDTAYLYIRATFHMLLLQSLLAEQAARFVSMDTATRNAKNLQETMTLQFNKLRQWKITKELTELSSSFQSDSGT
jgi:F-type H+-transporting ATPase subunit gamma